MFGFRSLMTLALSIAAVGPAYQKPTRKSCGKGKGKGRTALRNWWAGTRTTSRHKRDPNSPFLAAAIAKRERKAAKLGRDLAASVNNNWAHGLGKKGLHLTACPYRAALNPFHVNR